MDGLTISTGSTGAVQTAKELRESLSPKGFKTNDAKGADSFADTLKEAINTVDKLQKDADKKMQDLATGKSQNIHETMIATEKADLALRLMVQVRNKVIDAYQEIMKMQV